jgi:hypothetical protein
MSLLSPSAAKSINGMENRERNGSTRAAGALRASEKSKNEI